MTRHRRLHPGAFSLAFLDVMSCGLGAVILVFLIFKHGTEVRPPPPSADLTQDIAQQTSVSADLTAERAANQDSIGRIKDAIASIEAEIAKEGATARAADARAAELNAEAQSIEETKKENEQQAKDAQNAAVKVTGEGERTYLIGMRVQGARIALMLDSSASMMAKDIVDVIRLKNRSPADRVRTPKWIWASKTLRWLTANLPNASTARFFTFSTDTTEHGDQSWIPANQPERLTEALNRAINVAPTGGTNLEQAFDAVMRASPPPDVIYLITDGMPTLHGELGTFSLAKMQSCYGKRQTVTPDCRVEYFARAMDKLYQRAPNIQVNVVLLPLEGDPEASLRYWVLANRNGGTMLAPAESWP